MYWIFGVKFVDLGDSCAVGGDPNMNIIIARVTVLNAPEYVCTLIIVYTHTHLPMYYLAWYSLMYMHRYLWRRYNFHLSLTWTPL